MNTLICEFIVYHLDLLEKQKYGVFKKKKTIILWKQGTFTTERVLEYNCYGINGNGCLHWI